MKAKRSVNDQRRFRRWWVVPLMALALFAAFRGRGQDSTPEPVPEADQALTEAEIRDRATPPSVSGARLSLLDEASRPPLPAQWESDRAPVPFGQWWSGLATGPGIPALWAQPLLLRMNELGRADLSAPTRTTRADGFRDADIIPALFFEFGQDPSIRVVDSGSFHVRFTVSTSDVDLTVTLIQGSPFVEIEGSGTLTMTVPALSGLDDRLTGPSVERFTTAAGPWLLASSDAPNLSVDGDTVVLVLSPGVRHAIGPAPDGLHDGYDAAALVVAVEPLIGTFESLSVAPDGSVEQVLHQRRGSGADTPVAWTLLPHHRDFLAGDSEPIGSLTSVHGSSQVVTAAALVLEYPAVPILWDTVAPEGFETADIGRDDLPPVVIGSYFGAKRTATDAVVHDVLRSSGASGDAEPFLEAARASLGALVTSGTDPQLTWEPGWGSVVVTPAEFGAGTELNDHQLQNGYWVGAAASVVVADPTQRNLLREGIDLLIADYAGATVVPHFAGVVSNEGTWSSFAGHSWASGIGGFAAGNNLESISESSYAWWAAAKWFLATDRPVLAEPFVARLTIESWLTGYEWLPTADHQSDDATVRPWTGVVWASKADPGTWFHGSDEAALGIRLLPVGPQSFSRYPDADAVRAAEDRWIWCDEHGSGCVDRWWNLLDADAAVAGRATLPAGDLPEESTTEMVRRWWRAHWESSAVAEGWQCSPGSTMRQDGRNSLVALVTNPSSEPSTVLCVHDVFAPFEVVVEPRSSLMIPVNRA